MTLAALPPDRPVARLAHRPCPETPMAPAALSRLPPQLLTAHDAHRYFSDAIGETCKMVDRLATGAEPVFAIEAVFEEAVVSRRHCHDRGQISLVRAGTMTLQGDGYVVVVPAGHAVWIPAGHMHQARGSTGLAVLSAYADAAGLPPLPARCAVLQVSDLFEPLFKRLIARQIQGLRDAISDALLVLLHEEMRVARQPAVTAAMPRDPRLLRVCQAVLREPTIAARKEELARIGNLSSRTMTRLFRSELGTTYTDWVQQALGVHAVARLSNGQPVAQVAADLGYASPSAFTAMFRRCFGFCPSDLPAARHDALPPAA